MVRSRRKPAVPRPALALLAALLVASGAGVARAHSFSGTVRYQGELGPVSSRRPLCLCVYTDPQLQNSLGCLIFTRNDAAYNLDLGNVDLYLIAFLDLKINERLDAHEPFEIFDDRGAPPGDPVAGESGRDDIDFAFGDENIPAPTATPTATQPPTPSFTATSTATPTPSHTATATDTATPRSPPQTRTPTPTCAAPDDPACACAGDCDGNGQVAVNELITVVRIALGVADVSLCPAGDPNRDGTAQVSELVTAVRRSLDGC